MNLLKNHPHFLLILFLLLPWRAEAQVVPAHLPDELPAEEVLNGKYPFPPSPKPVVSSDTQGLAKNRLVAPPKPGVHPRVLISPTELPELRTRLKETVAGRAQMELLISRTEEALRKPGSWGAEFYQLLQAGDLAAVQAGMEKNKGLPPGIGHYQPYLKAIVMESLRALIEEDATRGKAAAAALTTYAQLAEPILDEAATVPMNDDVWRAKTTSKNSQGGRDLMGYQMLGYGYDFAYNFMTPAQQDQIRRTISKATKGRLWMGARLPHHFRNWNWVAVGLSQPLLALAIEGEEGYDPRVYKLGVEIARDYLTYAISAKGSSTEAVGYTQFGFVWANPFIVAASRRGDLLLAHSHFRAMLDWYLQSMEPFGGQWTSHGDGGDGGPSIGTLAMWRYFYPQDKRVAVLWQNYVQSTKDKPYAGNYHLIENLLWSSDPASALATTPVSELKLPTTSFDPERSSLNARTGWDAEATALQFECRTDSVGASHEHSDRGHFTFTALGRVWSKENFRSVETRHHSGILIDGHGQGYWPGPGTWLGLEDKGWALQAACDMKPAYDWRWPKQIVSENPETYPAFSYARWSSYKAESEEFHRDNAGVKVERDDRPAVKAFWTGFDKFGARLWDEDGWPMRIAHNPVQRAFRNITFIKQGQPYALIVDDIQKDNQERFYEWLMQTGMDTEIARLTTNDIVLCDASVPRDEKGQPKPKKGDRLLLVRVLDIGYPAAPNDFQSRPSFRLETFERKDSLLKAERGLAGARSFGLDKRLVVASRSAAPHFKILLFPFRQGEELPVTTWNEEKTKLTLVAGAQKEEFTFKENEKGRTQISVNRVGATGIKGL